MNMRRYPTNPNTTADKQIIVQSLCSVINTRKKKNRKKKLKKDLGYVEPLGPAFHIIHRRKKC